MTESTNLSQMHTDTNISTDVAINEPINKDSQESANKKLQSRGVKSALLYALRFVQTPSNKSSLLSLIKPKSNSKPVYMDLDLACILYDKALIPVDVIWFKNLRDKADAIHHHSDELIGMKELTRSPFVNEDSKNIERIDFRLNQVASEVQSIALVVSCFQGDALNSVQSGEVYLRDDDEQTLIYLDLTSLSSECDCLWLAQLERGQAGWRLLEKQQPVKAKHKKQVVQRNQATGRKLPDFMDAKTAKIKSKQSNTQIDKQINKKQNAESKAQTNLDLPPAIIQKTSMTAVAEWIAKALV